MPSQSLGDHNIWPRLVYYHSAGVSGNMQIVQRAMNGRYSDRHLNNTSWVFSNYFTIGVKEPFRNKRFLRLSCLMYELPIHQDSPGKCHQFEEGIACINANHSITMKNLCSKCISYFTVRAMLRKLQYLANTAQSHSTAEKMRRPSHIHIISLENNVQ